jgi:MerR family mercuric resistance operon transcriptional regulator
MHGHREHSNNSIMTISQLAKSAGIKTETVRYYQRIGLLRTPGRPGHGFRSYDDGDALHLRFIRHGRTLGFTLDEIAALLRLSAADCKEAEKLATERLAAVRAKLADLQRLETALLHTVSECRRRQPHAGCPLIEVLLADG